MTNSEARELVAWIEATAQEIPYGKLTITIKRCCVARPEAWVVIDRMAPSVAMGVFRSERAPGVERRNAERMAKGFAE